MSVSVISKNQLGAVEQRQGAVDISSLFTKGRRLCAGHTRRYQNRFDSANSSLPRDYGTAVAMLKARRLIKGYSGPHARGLSKFDRVMTGIALVEGRKDAADWVDRLTFRLNQLLKQDLKQFGLSIVEWRVLAGLAVNEHATINEIARYAKVEQPTSSRLLLRMTANLDQPLKESS